MDPTSANAKEGHQSRSSDAPSWLVGSAREENRVDDVHNGVGCLNVAADNVGLAIHHVGVARLGDGEAATVDGRDGSGLDEIVGAHLLTGDDVVGEDLGEVTLRVSEKLVDGGLVDLAESIIGWGEDRERSGRVQRVNETSSLDGGDKGGQRRVVGSCRSCWVLGHSVEASRTGGGHRGTGRAERGRSAQRGGGGGVSLGKKDAVDDEDGSVCGLDVAADNRGSAIHLEGVA